MDIKAFTGGIFSDTRVFILNPTAFGQVFFFLLETPCVLGLETLGLLNCLQVLLF